MSEFQKLYEIDKVLIPSPSKRRPGKPLESVHFIVAHDTGNIGSSAMGNVRYYVNSRDEISASAHFFVDDEQIIECIPAMVSPEVAYHVRKGVLTDNRMYGHDANHYSIGIELCFGKKIDPQGTYDRYVWLIAFCCYQFRLDPTTSIVGHFMLDPDRRSDPVTGLHHINRTYPQLLADVRDMYLRCRGLPPLDVMDYQSLEGRGTVSVRRLNIRGRPTTFSEKIGRALKDEVVQFVGYTDKGESFQGNSRWYRLATGGYCWSGGVVALED